MRVQSGIRTRTAWDISHHKNLVAATKYNIRLLVVVLLIYMKYCPPFSICDGGSLIQTLREGKELQGNLAKTALGQFVFL